MDNCTVKQFWRVLYSQKFPASCHPHSIGIFEIPKPIPCEDPRSYAAFFPGGYGVYHRSIDTILNRLPVMILGQDWGNQQTHDDRCEKAKTEITSTGTWSNLLLLLKSDEVKINPRDCFFSNVYMGLREGCTSPTADSFPGKKSARKTAEFRAFQKRSVDFLETQIQIQRPSLILTLGRHAPTMLARLSDDLAAWRQWEGFSKLDEETADNTGALIQSVRFEKVPKPVTVVALMHPAPPFRTQNVKCRRYKEFKGDTAEKEIVRAAMKAAGLSES